MRLRFGLAAWSNSHFDHALYPLRTLHAEHLPCYASLFGCAEAVVLHHKFPDAAELAAWVENTRKGFTFLPKMHKEATHGSGGAQVAERWLEGLTPLRDAGRLGPVLLQFPPSLGPASGWDLVQSLLGLAGAGTFAVEVRNTSWFTPAFERMLEEHEAPLVWSTWPTAFAPPWATGEVGYVRFTGKHLHVRGRHVTVADRLDDILEVRKRLQQVSWKECFVLVTNPFEGNAVDSLPRIAAALGETELAQRFTREPGQPLFPDARQRTLPGEV
ncbi:MAG TPA: DUF72 domain-containing protein [Candidatus Thermoplasmatota archaeon]|nr:DUF72 domain-containing protein [Candidatus Thermoplasmatota archaeon]